MIHVPVLTMNPIFLFFSICTKDVPWTGGRFQCSNKGDPRPSIYIYEFEDKDHFYW